MKKLFLIAGLLWAATCSAQFVPGQVLTAAELNSAFANTAPAPGITCLGTSSALNYTSNVFSCNGSINAVTLSGATFASPGPIGSVSPSTGSFSSISTPSATIGGGTINATSVGATSASTGAFTTLSASSSVSGAGFTTLLSPYLLSATASSTYAPLASPTFTGTPAAPTAAAGTNTTQLATTANVVANFATPPTAGYGSMTPEPVAATSLSSTGNFTPSQTNGIVGTTTNNNANAGSVGELQSAQTSGTSLTSGSTVNATSLLVPAGDWNCWGQVVFVPVTGTIIADMASGITTTSVTLPAGAATTYLGVTATTGVNGVTSINTIQMRESFSTSTTVYIVGEATSVTGSTATVNGQIYCRRVR